MADTLYPNTNIPKESAWRSYSSSPADAPIRPTLALEVPSWGVVFMIPPEDALVHAQLSNAEPRYDHLLNGEFIIALPPGCGKLRCKSLKIGFRATSILDMGPGRMGEVDILFQREVKTAPPEGLVLEGTQRFDFSLILPSTLAPRDWHRNGRVANTLYAEVEGQPIAVGSHRVSPEPPVRTRSRSNSPPSLERLVLSASSLLSMVKKETVVPQPPAYDPTNESSDPTDHWLRGTHTAERIIRLIHNPDLSGGITVLNEQSNGDTPGLGHYEILLFSDIWTISTLLKATLALTDLPPETTVFNFKVTLCQNWTIRSPRDGPDGPEIASSRRFVLIEEGKRPQRPHMFPGPSHPALWRGTAAGGSDDGILIVESKNRIPGDSLLRPSTIPGLITPIRVSHAFEIDIFFSVFGTQPSGKTMRPSGPGELRVMRVRRPVVLPGVCLWYPE
ncbi:hypothetical protein BCR39DRAFT_524504 [Naematelia encephala]|uniref:Uncharacterized protein n=1 Tax=Naematelia encephala TaxID=71784 RepID=A0A1Y2BDP5_9TREE|nr:hypothetical protein BCR39DRAFT_524504 [Naematelia encephala]